MLFDLGTLRNTQCVIHCVYQSIEYFWSNRPWTSRNSVGLFYLFKKNISIKKTVHFDYSQTYQKLIIRSSNFWSLKLEFFLIKDSLIRKVSNDRKKYI